MPKKTTGKMSSTKPSKIKKHETKSQNLIFGAKISETVRNICLTLLALIDITLIKLVIDNYKRIFP